jgi:hypothetical protein
MIIISLKMTLNILDGCYLRLPKFYLTAAAVESKERLQPTWRHWHYLRAGEMFLAHV